MNLPGLRQDGAWDLPERLNMAAQCLGQPAEQIAIIDLTEGARRDVSYGALGEMVDGLARALMGAVAKGDRVGVLLSQSPWCAAAHLAIWKIGAISVPLFKLFKHDALASRVMDAGCGIVLTDAEGAGMLGDLAQAWIASDVGRAGADVPCAGTGPEDAAVLIYTSGTTGSPKGALHGHRVLTGHLPGVAMSHDLLGQAGDCLWTPADWAWIGGLFDVLMPGLALGVPVVAARMSKFTPEGCARIVAQGDVRNVFFPPTALRMLKAADVRLPGLRSVARAESLWGPRCWPGGGRLLAWISTSSMARLNAIWWRPLAVRSLPRGPDVLARRCRVMRWL
jgi:acetyl-CoA synthetase